jgi:ethanolamine utilization protein EutP (predicted NTPase)
MKIKKLAALAVAFVILSTLSVGAFAESAETKFVGVITKIEISGADATTAKATLKDNKTEELIVIVVNDELTLDKFKDHRIVVGDEIRCKYEKVDGKNVSTYFRKTAGC